MTKPFFEEAAFKAMVPQKIKLGRIGKVEDLMGAVLFLGTNASSQLMRPRRSAERACWSMAAGLPIRSQFSCSGKKEKLMRKSIIATYGLAGKERGVPTSFA